MFTLSKDLVNNTLHTKYLVLKNIFSSVMIKIHSTKDFTHGCCNSFNTYSSSHQSKHTILVPLKVNVCHVYHIESLLIIFIF